MEIMREEGLAQIHGLHIRLDSVHWLFVCDARGLGNKWLESAALALDQGGSGEQTEPRNGIRSCANAGGGLIPGPGPI